MAVTSALVDSTLRTGSTGTTSTVTGVQFGSAFAGRVLVPAYLVGSVGQDPTSGTVDGQAAVVTGTNSSGSPGLGFLSAVVASNTSGNVVGNFSSSDTLAVAGVVALTGAGSATPSDTFAVLSTSSTIDVAAGGCVVAVAFAASSGSWTGATQLGSVAVPALGGTYYIATFDNGGGALSGRTISYTTADLLYAAAFDADAGGAFSVAANGGTYSITGAAVATDIKPDWTLVGITEAAVDASDNYTLSEPTGAQQDDILVVDIAIRSNVLHTNADWTFPQSDSSGNTTNNTTGSIVSYQTGYCIRGGSAPSYVFAKTGGSRCLGTVRAYRSSRAGTPVFDTSAELAMGAAGTSLTLSGGVTTAEAGELLVTGVFGARANTVSNMDGATEVTGNSGSVDTTTKPVRGTWTERSDRNNGTSPTVALACYDAVKPTAGSTGNLTATESQSARHGMTVMAFKHPPSSSNKTIAANGGSYSVTGAAVSTERGRVVAANGGTYAVTGAAVTLRRNLPLVVGGGSYSVSGAAVTLREDRKVSALGGTYAVTGASVTVRHGYSVSVGAGTYSVNGASVSLLHAWKVAAAGGTYAVSGSDVTLRYGYVVGVGGGSYALTGASVATSLGRNVGATAGSYSISGASVGLTKAWRVDASGGSYAITGADVTLTKTSAGAFSVAADGGSYAITGSAVPLVHDWIVGAEGGSYAVTGATAALRHDWRVSAEGGAYEITGADVDLIRAGSVVIDVGAGSYEITGAAVDLTQRPVRARDGGGGKRGNWLYQNRVRRWAYFEEEKRLEEELKEAEAKAVKARSKVKKLKQKPKVSEFKIDEALLAAEEARLEAIDAQAALEVHRAEIDDDDEDEFLMMVKAALELRDIL